jgi:citrate synthase
MAGRAGGLEGVVAAETSLSHVDGEAGELIVAGHPIETLAPGTAFEAVVHLLWHGRLPRAAELGALRAELAARRRLPPPTLALLRAAAHRALPVMDALRMATASLDLAGGPGTPEAQALHLVAAFPAIVGAYWRLRQGAEPVPPREDLAHAAFYLHQLSGEVPAPARTRAVETYLNTVADHGLNASTFAARVIASTRADLVSAVTGAVGALKGPLHGGAPGPALDLVLEVGEPGRAEAVIRDKLARGERLMGFGHRVYRVRDPRADVLGAEAERLYAAAGDARRRALYRLAREVEDAALRCLRAHRPDRPLHTNVEFYTALLLHGAGLEAELFTPTFAVARVAGWTAHCLEQLATGRLIRPLSVYIGPREGHPAPAVTPAR